MPTGFLLHSKSDTKSTDFPTRSVGLTGADFLSNTQIMQTIIERSSRGETGASQEHSENSQPFVKTSSPADSSLPQLDDNESANKFKNELEKTEAENGGGRLARFREAIRYSSKTPRNHSHDTILAEDQPLPLL